jgi:hypothetical protein
MDAFEMARSIGSTFTIRQTWSVQIAAQPHPRCRSLNGSAHIFDMPTKWLKLVERRAAAVGVYREALRAYRCTRRASCPETIHDTWSHESTTFLSSIESYSLKIS